MGATVGTTPVFEWNIRSQKRFTINQGGSSSSKTYSILQVLLMLARSKPQQTITVTAETLPALKAGAIRDFETIVSKAPFKDYIAKRNVSPYVVKLHNGSVIEFKSFKDAETAKHGKRDILFINEASSVPYEIAKNLMLRSRKVFIDFNPNAEFWVHHHYTGHPNAQWIFSTFRDNPFADADIVADILDLKETAPELYKVYGLGRRGNFKGQVFPGIDWIEQLPRYLKDRTYGLDVGFKNSFTALVEIGFADGAICGRELLYERGLTDMDIVRRLDDMGIDKYQRLVVDNANQATIEELSRAGYDVIGCAKRDVAKEVQQMLNYKWRITKDSVNWKKEAINYVYQKEKKTGEYLNTPIKAYDHSWDASRYAFLEMVNGSNLPQFMP